MYVVKNYDFIIRILIEKNDIKQAQQYLTRMEQISNQLKDPHSDITVLINRAILLKTSRRAPKRGKAEKILKKVLDKGIVNYELTVDVLLNLCELLLTEIRPPDSSTNSFVKANPMPVPPCFLVLESSAW